MADPRTDDSAFVVVPRRPGERLRQAAVWLGWPLSLLLLAVWMQYRAGPGVVALRAEHAGLVERHAALSAELAAQKQQVATLARSDQISRAANLELQKTLAERDAEIVALRADVQFFERLVGATGQRRGLGVHELQFRPEAGGSWRYQLTLTQNLNRGAVTRGRMRMTIEGVAAGALSRLDWGRLRQDAEDSGQEYSFRYFQTLEGSIVLPAGFTPQRVSVTLDAGGTAVESTLPWAVVPD